MSRLARLLSHGEVSCESARWLAKQIGDRLPPSWGAVWRDKGCSELDGTPTQQLRTLVDFLRDIEIRCARCQVRHVGTCRQCHIGRCTQWQQAEEQFEVCDVSTKSTPNLGGSNKEHSLHWQLIEREGKEWRRSGVLTCTSWA
jgi:hypothetical protein